MQSIKVPRLNTVFLLAVLCGCSDPSAVAQTAPTESGAAVYRQTPASRDGTGKVYLGREIARVMGHLAAGWLERPTREIEENPRTVVANLDLEPDDVVADLGAGTGYFSFRIAPLVPRGEVIAVDIQPEMLARIEKRRRAEGVRNVTTLLAGETDSRLPRGRVDVVLMVDAYHEFSHPKEVMESVVAALKPGGRVVLVEYRGEDRALPIKRLHKMTEAQTRREMAFVGLRWLETRNVLPSQHLMVFVKP